MRHLIFVWVLGAVAIFLGSCGNLQDKYGRLKSGSTQVQFSTGSGGSAGLNAETYMPQYGRVMVYLVGVGGTSASMGILLQSDTDNTTFPIPNGSYKVGAVGWEGPGGCTPGSNCYPMEGVVRCSNVLTPPVVNLAGGNAQIVLPTTTANCQLTTNSVFSPGYGGASTTFSLVQLYVCANGSSLPGTCNTPTSGHDVSIEMPKYFRDGGGNTQIGGNFSPIGCASSVTNSATNTNKNIPVAQTSDPNAPEVTRIRVWSSTGGTCTGTIVGEWVFGHGLSNNPEVIPPGTSSYSFVYGPNATLKLAGPGF